MPNIDFGISDFSFTRLVTGNPSAASVDATPRSRSKMEHVAVLLAGPHVELAILAFADLSSRSKQFGRSSYGR